MAPEKHDLFATLTPTSRTAIRSLALENGLGYDDVVQALLGRTLERGEGARLMAQKLHGDAEPELLEEVATLAETWPQSVQPTPMVLVSGATVRDGKAAEFAEAAIAHARKVGHRLPTSFDFRPGHAVEVVVCWPWSTEATVRKIHVTEEDAEALLPWLVIPKGEPAAEMPDGPDEATAFDVNEIPNTMTLVSGGKLSPGAEEKIADVIAQHRANPADPFKAPPST